MKPMRQELHMKTAMLWSERSTCKRPNRSIGAVITNSTMDKILAIGYNGPPRGLLNDSCRNVVGNCGCFPQNVLVSVKNGFKKIQDIVVGDRVLTHQGRYRKVTKVFHKQDYSGRYVYLSSGITNGKQSRFICTEEHPILIERFNKIFWEKAIDIQIGDTVFCLSRKCKSCQRLIPNFRELCNTCFQKSSKSIKHRKQISERMKKNNPMRKLYGNREILDNKKVKKLVKKQKQGHIELGKILEQHIINYGLDKQYKCIIVDHIKTRPDIILIDFEHQKVIAYEYEKTTRNFKRKQNKYLDDTQYDEIRWFVENKLQDEKDTFNSFNRLKITNKKIVKCRGKGQRNIYNLEVEEDNSYVCQKLVVHNCIHAEMNAIAKVDNTIMDKIMFVTMSPCEMCASLIIQSNISIVYYCEEYRDTKPLQLLKKVGIVIRHLKILE